MNFDWESDVSSVSVSVVSINFLMVAIFHFFNFYYIIYIFYYIILRFAELFLLSEENDMQWVLAG